MLLILIHYFLKILTEPDPRYMLKMIPFNVRKVYMSTVFVFLFIVLRQFLASDHIIFPTDSTKAILVENIGTLLVPLADFYVFGGNMAQ